MDKEALALIGKLYVDIYNLSAYTESLKARISELESQLSSNANNIKKNVQDLGSP